jgi:hypothetical protein
MNYYIMLMSPENGMEDSVSVETPLETGGQPKPGGDGTGLLSKYYDNIDFSVLIMSKFQKVVIEDWNSSESGLQPAPYEFYMGEDTFSIRWTGLVVPLYDETYTFYTNTDDGVRLWVNDQLLIPKWTAIKWAELVQAAAVAVERNSDVSIKLDENNDPIPLNLNLRCFLVTANDSAFRTFLSTEYYWHKRQAHGGELASAPGSSNHCNGIAIDYNINWDTNNRNPKQGSMSTVEGKWIEWYGHQIVNGKKIAKGYGEDFDESTYKWTYTETWHWEFQ